MGKHRLDSMLHQAELLIPLLEHAFPDAARFAGLSCIISVLDRTAVPKNDAGTIIICVLGLREKAVIQKLSGIYAFGQNGSDDRTGRMHLGFQRRLRGYLSGQVALTAVFREKSLSFSGG